MINLIFINCLWCSIAGFPIEDDPLYNNPVWGPARGRGGNYFDVAAGGRPRDELLRDLDELQSLNRFRTGPAIPPEPPIAGDPAEEERWRRRYRPDCRHCAVVYRDPTPGELHMYLHALEYSGPGWRFRAPPPHWARDALPNSESLKSLKT